jgi:hypothetical protein
MKTATTLVDKSQQTKQGGALSRLQVDLPRLRADIAAAQAERLEIGDYYLKQSMAKAGVDWTHENYIAWNWGCELPEEWDENLVPECFQIRS